MSQSIRFSFGALARRKAKWSPSALFAPGVEGFWFDPSALPFMFQDVDGTVPITAAGQIVARINDRSGRGNHLVQATVGARPVLGRNPAGGLRNKVLNSESLASWGAVQGGAGSVPTINFVGSATMTTLPDGAAGADAGKGWTCTGLAHEAGALWWGNIALNLPAGTVGQRQLIQTNLAGTSILATVSIADQPQGVAVTATDLYYAQPTFGEVRKVSRLPGNAETVFLSGIPDANGLAVAGDRVWVSSGTQLLEYTLSGALVASFSVGVIADHMCYDSSRNWLWITSGVNGAAGVLTIVDAASQMVLKSYTLADALALEGIAVVGSTVYLAHDGYYHGAEITPPVRRFNELHTFDAGIVTNSQVNGKLADYVVFRLNGGTTTADFSQLQQDSKAAGARVGSIYLWTADGGTKSVALNVADSGGNLQEVKTVTGTPTRFSTYRASYTGPSEAFNLRLRGAQGTSDAAAVYVFGAQVEAGSVVSPYQTVVSPRDVTEAGKSDCWYLAFDGVDDWLGSAATVSLSGTDTITLCAGIGKQSDAARGVVLENASQTFSIEAPTNTLGGRYAFRSNGDAVPPAQVVSPNSFAAPITNIVTAIGSIPGDSAALRVNGVQVAVVADNQGIGTYQSGTLFVGRRAGTSLSFNGNLYGLTGVGGLPDPVDLELWTAVKAGITL